MAHDLKAKRKKFLAKAQAVASRGIHKPQAGQVGCNPRLGEATQMFAPGVAVSAASGFDAAVEWHFQMILRRQ